MRIAITGASGLVGRHISDTLCAEGHEVRAISTRNAIRPEDLEACDAVVQTAHQIQPDSKSRAILDDAYLTYRRIYPALRQISNRVNAESAAQPVVSVS